MTGETIPVVPGIDMQRALDRSGSRLTKKWLREYLRDNPQKDFRNVGFRSGTYVNGQDAINFDLTLEVRGGYDLVAVVNFQPTDTNEWGYQAVVR